MIAVNIGIGREYDLGITQALNAVLNAKCSVIAMPLVLSGFPLRLKTAWVMTSRAVLSVPDAESPSVRKIIDLSPISA